MTKQNITEIFAEHLENPIKAQSLEWFSNFYDTYDDLAAADDYNPVDNLPVIMGAATMIGGMLASTNGLECHKRGEKLSDHDPMEVIEAIMRRIITEYHNQVRIIEDE